MNSFFIKEMAERLIETPFRSEGWGELVAQIQKHGPANEAAVTSVAEKLIFERYRSRVSMALGHIAERAQVRFAG